MVFSADDRVLIKVLRQEKRYGANSPDLNPVDYQIWGQLQERSVDGGKLAKYSDIDYRYFKLKTHWHIADQILETKTKITIPSPRPTEVN